ncbi:hypothetical protein [Sphingopyxis sp. 2PD]|uniref:hypothetical protein n=1 Tax=Sphingopyxis sp. 2PD TaxID=2502196 RepID=UPI0010F5BC26|nr:hypothetical protein [Sphingopyxis sp. 2PD]
MQRGVLIVDLAGGQVDDAAKDALRLVELEAGKLDVLKRLVGGEQPRGEGREHSDAKADGDTPRPRQEARKLPDPVCRLVRRALEAAECEGHLRQLLGKDDAGALAAVERDRDVLKLLARADRGLPQCALRCGEAPIRGRGLLRLIREPPRRNRSAIDLDLKLFIGRSVPRQAARLFFGCDGLGARGSDEVARFGRQIPARPGCRFCRLSELPGRDGGRLCIRCSLPHPCCVEV